MSESQKSAAGIVQTIATVIGGLSGMISICVVVFYGGTMAEQVHSLKEGQAKLDNRVTELEQHAAPVTQAFMKAAVARDDQIEGRVIKLEDLKTTVYEVRTDVKINGTKTDEIVKTIDRLEKSVDDLKQRKP